MAVRYPNGMTKDEFEAALAANYGLAVNEVEYGECVILSVEELDALYGIGPGSIPSEKDAKDFS